MGTPRLWQNQVSHRGMGKWSSWERDWIWLMKDVVFQVSMSVGFSPGSITIISCANTEGWSLTVQGRGFKSRSLVTWKVFGVWRTNWSSILVLILVFEVLSVFVFQSGHDLMSSRDKVRWDDGWTFHGSPAWGSSILHVVSEWRLVRGGNWSMLDGGSGGSWTVMNSWMSSLKSFKSFLYSCRSWIKDEGWFYYSRIKKGESQGKKCVLFIIHRESES